MFRNATTDAPHRPQSRQQERNDWITFHFCGYTNEVQCRSQTFSKRACRFRSDTSAVFRCEGPFFVQTQPWPLSSTFEDSSIELPADLSSLLWLFTNERIRKDNRYGKISFLFLSAIDVVSLTTSSLKCPRKGPFLYPHLSYNSLYTLPLFTRLTNKQT